MKSAKREFIEKYYDMIIAPEYQGADLTKYYDRVEQELNEAIEKDGWIRLNADSMPKRFEECIFFREDTGVKFFSSLDKDDEDYIRGNGHWETVSHYLILPPDPVTI